MKEVRNDPMKIIKLIGTILIIITILGSWIYSISAMNSGISINTRHWNDIEQRVRILEKTSEHTTTILDIMNERLERMDKKLDKLNER